MAMNILTTVRPGAGVPVAGRGKINGLAFTYEQRAQDVLVTWCAWHYCARILTINQHGERQTLEDRVRQADRRLPRHLPFTFQPTR